MVQQLTKSVDDKLDIFQFAHKRNCSTEDAVVTLIHLISNHLDKFYSTTRALFTDFMSVFNINSARALTGKDNSNGSRSSCNSLVPFMSPKQKAVKINYTYSTSVVTNSGTPKGYVSSLLLFTLNTDDCKTDSPNTFILKFLNDTTLLPLLSPTNFLSIQQCSTDRLVEWCENNPLINNPKTTKEIIFGLSESSYPLPVTVHKTKTDKFSSIGFRESM